MSTSHSRRRRRWGWWITGVVALVIVGGVAGPFIYIHLLSSKAPAQLSLKPTATPASATAPRPPMGRVFGRMCQFLCPYVKSLPVASPRPGRGGLRGCGPVPAWATRQPGALFPVSTRAALGLPVPGMPATAHLRNLTSGAGHQRRPGWPPPPPKPPKPPPYPPVPPGRRMRPPCARVHHVHQAATVDR